MVMSFENCREENVVLLKSKSTCIFSLLDWGDAYACSVWQFRGGHFTLEIPLTTLNDTGEYSVEVRNEQGHIISTCYLQVERKYTVKYSHRLYFNDYSATPQVLSCSDHSTAPLHALILTNSTTNPQLGRTN